MLTCFNVQTTHYFSNTLKIIVIPLCPASLKRVVFYKVPDKRSLIEQLTQNIVIGWKPQALAFP